MVLNELKVKQNQIVFSPFIYVCHEYSTGFKADLDFVKGNGLSELTPINCAFVWILSKWDFTERFTSKVTLSKL